MSQKRDYYPAPHIAEISLFLHGRIAISTFYPRDAMLARVFATATCLSVRLSVCHTPVLCLERKQDREMYTPSDSPITLVSGEG